MSKKLHTCLYEDGKDILFVPAPRWWRLREQDPKTRKPLGAFYNQLGKWHDYPCIEPWFKRTGSLPENVTIVKPDQYERAGRAWDYVDICDSCKPRISANKAYRRWVAGCFKDWRLRKWLYGFELPAGIYLVDQRLVKLRHEISVIGICDARGDDQTRPPTPKIPFATYRGWKKNSTLHASIDALMPLRTQLAAALDKPPVPKSRSFLRKLRHGRRRVIETFLHHASLAECCRRVSNAGPGLIPAEVQHMLTDAKRLGAELELLEFLLMRGKFKRTIVSQRGLIGEKLLVPSEGQLAFRKIANKRRTDEGIAELARSLPRQCFDKWFADWTLPQRMHTGLRSKPSRDKIEEAIVQPTNGRAAPAVTATRAEIPEAPRKRRGRPAVQSEAAKTKIDGIIDAAKSGKFTGLKGVGSKFDVTAGYVSTNSKERRGRICLPQLGRQGTEF